MNDIRISRVDKVFGSCSNAFVALKDINLDIEGGAFMSLLGPSGCGKSTLLRCIAGLETLSGGAVAVGGGKTRPGFDQMGMVFQSSTLLPWLSIIDNVLYPVRIKGRAAVESYRKRGLELLDQVGLSRVADQMPDSLSGGMQQRAGIVRGLIMDPDVLLMDEPFSALDAMTREELQMELIRLHQETGKTFVFVTHAISEAVLLSTKISVMQAFPGRIAETMDVDFPYPRDLSLLTTEKAKDLDNRIRGLIYGRDAEKGGS